MLIRFREERGAAMIVALMVSFIVLLMGTAVVAGAIHDGNQSQYDRRRLESIAAAEAGVNYMFSYIQNTAAATLNCTSTQSLASGPSTASFTATLTLYNSTGSTLSCPPPVGSQTAGDTVAGALITSAGTSAGGATRTMQAYMTLTPSYGGWGAAIISNTGMNLGNNLTLNGNTSNDADIYVDSGDFVATNVPIIYGTIYVHAGAMTLGNGVSVHGSVWANTAVALNQTSSVTGDATSSTSSLTVNTSGTGAHVSGNGKAGATITGSANIAGTSSPNTTSGQPPQQAFPQITFTATDQTNWQNAGYTVNTYSGASACTNAYNFIKTNPVGNYVVRIAATCGLSFVTNDSVTLNGNLAIVTDGSISNVNQMTWTGSGGTPRYLFLIDDYRTGLTCAGGAYDVSDSNLTHYTNVQTFFYSPCSVNINNNQSFSGQVFANVVNINNQTNMTFKPTLVPGYGSITGYNQNIVYIREVI